MPDDLASQETVSAWSEVSSNTHHKTSRKGITCLDLLPSKPNLVSGQEKLSALRARADSYPCARQQWEIDYTDSQPGLPS